MEVRLVYQKGRSRSQVLRLQRDETLIGRQSGCDVRIPSEDVSRRHCVLRKENGVLTVEDLQSVNGTFVNDRLVTRAVVRSGDRLQVGPATFLVEYERAPTSTLPTQRSRNTQPLEPEMVGEMVEELPEAEILEEEVEAEIIEEDLSPIVEEVEELPVADILEDNEDANAAVLELVDWEELTEDKKPKR